MTHKIHIIGGPTASGKSAQALKIAEDHDGVIINCDSMQIYDGLSVLTAQPPEEDLAQAPHLLYGALHPNEACSAGNWREMVEPIIHDVLKQGKTPIICGGSGLYIRALTNGLSPIPDIPDDIRSAASAKQEELGNPAFYDVLKQRDPVMAARLHPDHTARLVRAWEVPARETLYDRCNRRFTWMLDNGALEQLDAFNQAIEQGDISPNALLNNALGVKPLTAYLRGDMSKEDAIERGQGDTRRYAKRQVTWFRHQVKENKNVAKITIIS